MRPCSNHSLFSNAHRPLYRELLNGVRVNGDWERWLDFFSEAVAATATQGVQTAQALRLTPAMVNKTVAHLQASGPLADPRPRLTG